MVMVLGIVTTSLAGDYIIDKNNKDISKPKTEKVKKNSEPDYSTGWTYQGQPVFITKGGKGSAYVMKTKKKDGTQYKQYLGKELTAEYKKLCGLQ